MSDCIENKKELNILGSPNNKNEYNFVNLRIINKDFSIFELYRKYKKGQIILGNSYKKESNWNENQQCKLIESILMGLNISTFYLKQKNNAIYEVVDGNKRLIALFSYLEDQFELQNLEIFNFLNNKRFSQLNGELGIYRSQIEDYQVYSKVILPPTPENIIINIYNRVN